MKKQLISVVFDRRKRLNIVKKGAVEFYIYISPTCKRYIHYSTVTQNEWEMLQKSDELKDEMKRIERICQAMIVLNEELTLENLNVRLGIETKPKKPSKKQLEAEEEQIKEERLIKSKTSFIDFIEENYQKGNFAPGTLMRKKVVINTLKAFKKLNRFEDVNERNIEKYDEWLDNGNRTRPTKANYHKQVHLFITKAIKKKYILDDPYKYCEIEKGKTKKRIPLSETELLKLINHKFEGNVEFVRDLFIFSAYTGHAYSDVMNFKYSKMTVQIQGQDFIDGSRIKTGSDFFTPILPHAMDVLKKYYYKLPYFTDQFINRTLKKIKEECGISKKITFHIARHSFATLAINNDVPVAYLQKMLGHKKIETTMIYAKVLPTTVVKQTKNLLEVLK